MFFVGYIIEMKPRNGMGIKKILINCGIPLAEEYVGLVSEYEFEKFIKAKCQADYASKQLSMR